MFAVPKNKFSSEYSNLNIYAISRGAGARENSTNFADDGFLSRSAESYLSAFVRDPSCGLKLNADKVSGASRGENGWVGGLGEGHTLVGYYIGISTLNTHIHTHH